MTHSVTNYLNYMYMYCVIDYIYVTLHSDRPQWSLAVCHTVLREEDKSTHTQTGPSVSRPGFENVWVIVFYYYKIINLLLGYLFYYRYVSQGLRMFSRLMS